MSSHVTPIVPPTSASSLTLEEKLALLSGRDFWSVGHRERTCVMSDGPHGVRKAVPGRGSSGMRDAYPATCFPTACALACSWDVELLHEVGTALAKECVHYKVGLLLGPGLNLKRHPANGRNFEYFSEDPVLSGRMAAALIRGIQADHEVGACAKHLCVNNQESCRFVVDAVVDERTLHELYYKGFEIAIKEARPAAVMGAYNKLNGIHCSEHAGLNTLLRKDWGYEGVLMTDWGATNDRVSGIKAGVDLEMPGSYGVHTKAIQQALSNGSLTMQHIDTCVNRTLTLINKYNNNNGTTNTTLKPAMDWEAHGALARRVAGDCIVLLQNEHNLLPLSPNGKTITLVGAFAKDEPRFQGMGSSQINAHTVLTVYEEMKKLTNAQILYAPGYVVDGPRDKLHRGLLQDAVETAKKAHTVVLVCGVDRMSESEGYDRTEGIGLPAQHLALIEGLSDVTNRLVVVLCNGGAVELPSRCLRQAGAVVEAYLPGQSGGGAIADVVFGRTCPSGKLAETVPESVDDVLAHAYFPGSSTATEHREGLNVGYRYFDTGDRKVRFPFGHGLSYTEFEYGKLRLELLTDTEEDTKVRVTFTVRNTGAVAGSEVVQCYVHDVASTVYRPTHELKGFTKSKDLQPGEERTYDMVLTRDAFALYDIGVRGWIVEPGAFEIQVASSSRDVRLRGTVDLTSGARPSGLMRRAWPPLPATTTMARPRIDDETFARRFGAQEQRALADMVARRHDDHPIFPVHRNTLLRDLRCRTLLGFVLYTVAYLAAAAELDPGTSRAAKRKLVRAAVDNLPLRTLVLFGEGRLSFGLLDFLIRVMNSVHCGLLRRDRRT